jgi:four helix bundle protein
MATQSFKDLIVWQKSQNFTLHVYANFARCRDFGFRDQIQRATVSISNNIAEGYGRRSDKSLAYFLTIARGSAAEVESMLVLAGKLRYLKPNTQQELLQELNEVSKLLTAFKAKIAAS